MNKHHTGNTCDTCGRLTRVEYHVDPTLWSHVTGSVYIGGKWAEKGAYHCLECFARMALESGITGFAVDGIHIWEAPQGRFSASGEMRL